MKDKIFIALSTFAEYGNSPIAMIKNSKIEYKLNSLGRRLTKNEIIKFGRSSSGIIAGVEPYDYKVLSNLPNLKCISRVGVGIDNIDLNYANKKNIVIKNTPDEVIRPVAELTLAMIFDLLRKTTYHTLLLKNKKWEKKAGSLLYGKMIGIIGTGRIGKEVSQLLLKLGAIVRAFDINQDLNWSSKNNVKYISYDELLSQSDIISIHASLTQESSQLISNKQISIMKNGVIIINTARGSYINEKAIIDGLISKKIGGLGLDVFHKEPYNGKLIDFDNVVLTPHLATLTNESRLKMEVKATKNLLNELNLKE